MADNKQARRKRLEDLINHWTEVKELTQSATTPTQADYYIQKVDKIENRISTFLGKRPGLRSVAAKLGYTGDMPEGTNEDLKEANGTAKPDDKKKKDDKGKGLDKPGTGEGWKGDGNNDNVPGKPRFVSRNGKIYAVYDVDIEGKGKIYAAWRVSKDMLDRYGIKEKDIRELTKEQFKNRKFQVFGRLGDVSYLGGHPIDNFLEQTAAAWGIAPGLLKDKQVQSVLFQAFMEEWDPSVTLQALKNTDWFKKKSDTRREYLLATEGQRKHLDSLAEDELVRWAQAQFGAVDWRKHVSPDQLKKWAHKAASGSLGWDPEFAKNKVVDIAKKVAGTAAYVAYEEATPNTELDKEQAFSRVRDTAISWLGYKAKPNQAELEWWGNQIAAGSATMETFEAHLRKRKQQLFPYLSPDETWMERAGSYKNIAEQLLGTSLSWKDNLLADFEARDETGKGTGQAMSFEAYEKKIRSTNRFWQSGTAKEESYGLVNFLGEMFGGPGGGSFPSTLNGGF